MNKKFDIYTKVSGGKFKGRKLALPALSTTRSTKSIIKESYFNTLQFDIIDKNFVEVFAGSGSMGIEALSRGAKKAFFIEKDKEAYNILLKNLDSLGVNNFFSIRGDSFKEFSNILDKIKTSSYFYFDPPFEIREGMEMIYEQTYKLIEKIPKEICKLITIEHMSKIKTPENIGIYKLKKSRKFGNTTLSYYNF